MKTQKKRTLRRAAILAAAMLAIAFGCIFYLNDYYRADTARIERFLPEAAPDILETEEGFLVFAPEAPEAGLIFYPGGKVEHTAYAPLMKDLASRGILCVLVEMPCRLAVLDMNAAEGVPEQFPEIERWYLGGHSLGGAMAASHLADHAEEFEGLVLLGAYSTADLADTALRVLSLYGSEDLVMDREKYDANLTNLPQTLLQIVIEGGCHAGFGMYGAQEGDGTPGISNEAQIQFTAEAIADFLDPAEEIPNA